MNHRKLVFTAAFTAFFGAPAQAAEGVVAANLGAMGGAAAGHSEDNAAVTVNPGLIALHERYDLHGHFQYGPDAVSRWGASVVDSRTSKTITAGFYYAGDRGNPPIATDDLPGWTIPGETPSNLRRHHNLTLALGTHGFDRRLAVGLSGTWAIFNHDLQGAGSTGNIDVGMGTRPTDWIDVGVAGRNLVPVNDIGVLPLTVVGGTRIHGTPGALLADVEWREDVERNSPITVSAGGEVLVRESAAIRAGWRLDGPQGEHRLTSGLAATGPGGSLDLAVDLPVAPGAPTLQGMAFLVSVHLAAPKVDDPVDF